MSPARPVSTLSRTSSAASVSGDDTSNIKSAATDGATENYRRTRKRFSGVQLVLLEQLYHQNSHPSREEREHVSREGGMETKSVTVWFQNRRQNERRAALHNDITSGSNHGRLMTSASFGHRRTVSFESTTVWSSRPSLDRVASRSELRVAPPRTPTRQRNPDAPLWDNMPSSPVQSPVSSPSRDFVDFVGRRPRKTRRTLEWACAAARLAGKEGGVKEKIEDMSLDLGNDTEEEELHEAVTPTSSLGSSDGRWTRMTGGKSNQREVHDQDMMAALALCGLGRRT